MQSSQRILEVVHEWQVKMLCSRHSSADSWHDQFSNGSLCLRLTDAYVLEGSIAEETENRSHGPLWNRFHVRLKVVTCDAVQADETVRLVQEQSDFIIRFWPPNLQITHVSAHCLIAHKFSQTAVTQMSKPSLHIKAPPINILTLNI